MSEIIEHNEYCSDLAHEHILLNRKKLLEFDPNADYGAWKEAVRQKLDELLGDMPEKVDLKVNVEWEKEHDTFIERRFTFYSEIDTVVPCHLWIPKNKKAPHPMVICLQGHSSGMHISMGRAKTEGDKELISGGDRDFAVQRSAPAKIAARKRGRYIYRNPRKLSSKAASAPDGRFLAARR